MEAARGDNNGRRDYAGVFTVAIGGLAATALMTILAWPQRGAAAGAEVSTRPWLVLATGLALTLLATIIALRRRARRQQHDAELRQQLEEAQRFRDIVEGMGDAVAVFARAGGDGAHFIVREINAAAAALEKLSRDRLVGRRLDSLSGVFARPEVAASVERVSGGDRAGRIEPFRVRDEKRTSWLAGAVSQLHSGEVVVVLSDCTASMEAAENAQRGCAELDVALDAARIGTWSWDLSQQQFRPDARCAALFEIAVGEAGSGASMREKIHPDDLAPTLATIQTAIAQRSAFEREFRVARGDGSWRHFRARGRPTPDGSGAFARIVGCTWDVTERVQREEHRQRAQRLASVGTLAGGMAHDLNNALAPIAMGLDLLVRHGNPDARASETIATMVESVRRAAAIVAQLVTFTRGGDGRAVATSMQRALDELRAVLEETFPESIRIRIDAPAAALPLVRIDFAQLQHVLLNLCVNARDAMPRGGSLEITCEAIDIDAASQAAAYPELKPGMHVAVHIADTGSGIAPEIRDCIFDPFFTTKPVGHGSGLGLSTALGVVRAQGGAIRFESEAGAGTRFTVLLPAASLGEKPVPPAGGISSVSEKTPLRSLRGCTVLVVDDEPAVRDVVRRGLEMEGVRVLVASDGAEAVAMFARSPEVIDVVLMDLLMPVMNGAMATAAIRRVRADAIIIAASGYATDAVVSEARKLGVSGILTKPYEMAALLAALEAAIAKR